MDLQTVITPTQREIKSKQTKDKLARAMIELLKQKSYDAVTVKNICNLANVSIGSFYHYFGEKDGLVKYFMFNSFDEYIEEHKDKLISDVDNITEAICDVFSWYVRYCVHLDVQFLKGYYTPSNKGTYGHRRPSGYYDNYESDTPYSNYTRKLLKCAWEKGQLKPDVDYNNIGENICTIVTGNLFDWCLSNGSFDVEKNVTEMITAYLAYYLA